MSLKQATTLPRWAVLAATGLVLATGASAQETDWKYRFEPAPGITAAGQPDEDGLGELAEAGYAAVIDLRGTSEDRGIDEKAIVEDLGMHYVSLPIVSRDAVNFENAEKLDRILGDYDKPVLVHCRSGNRVGALLALRAKLNGADDADALAFGRSAGMSGLESTVRARMAAQ